MIMPYVGYRYTWDLNDLGDINLGGVQRIQYVTEGDKVAQDITILLKTILGENIFHTDMGFDAITALQQDEFRKARIESLVRDALQDYEFLQSINEVDVGDPDDSRNIQISVSITTSYDETVTVTYTI